jgi:thiamine pyrophosphokinase
MRAIIVANGSVEENEIYTEAVQADDLIIAADGGALIALKLGLQPQVVIGDMDSLPPEIRVDLEERGCQFVAHSPRKDETDTELAVRYALQAGAQEIVLLGATGDRLDHTLANVLLLGMPQLERVPATIVAGNTQVWLLRGGYELELGGTIGNIVTLLPLGQDAIGVSTDGLEWPLHDDTLRFGSARGISNVMTAPEARVRLHQGCLLVLRLAEGENEVVTTAGQGETQERDELVSVYVAQGHMRANVIKSKLEAAGIPAMLSYEALSRIYGLTMDGIGQVRVLVRREDAAEARRLLAEEPQPEEPDEFGADQDPSSPA